MSCDRIVIEAFAKVNLSLDITGTDAIGYHSLETVMHSVSLSDVLSIDRRSGSGISVACSDPLIPEGSGNIAHAAAMGFLKAAELGEQRISIHIKKRIPSQAGLGGGSADAAAVIAGLNRLFGTEFSPEFLREIGLNVGMDVPFCLLGGCAFAEGRGEILTPLPVLPDCSIVIAKPPCGTSTKRAYSLYDSHSGKLERPDTEAMLSRIRAGDLAGVGANMINVFGALDETGEAEILSDIMRRAGALGAALSGSGSAVAGIFTEDKAVTTCLTSLRERDCICYITRPQPEGSLRLHT